VRRRRAVPPRTRRAPRRRVPPRRRAPRSGESASAVALRQGSPQPADRRAAASSSLSCAGVSTGIHRKALMTPEMRGDPRSTPGEPTEQSCEGDEVRAKRLTEFPPDSARREPGVTDRSIRTRRDRDERAPPRGGSINDPSRSQP
jgi:hypothetical protein